MQPIIGITANYSYKEHCFKIHEDYINAVSSAGGQPILLMPNSPLPHYIHGILFSGGGDVDPLLFDEQPLAESGEISPLRDSFELPLCKEALKQGLPILGICRGMQILALVSEGKIWQDIKNLSKLKHMQEAPRFYPTHSIAVTEGTLLHRLTGKTAFAINSFHHQAIADTGINFRTCAVSADGLTEAIEHVSLPFVIGVQWHPEAMTSSEQKALFLGLVEASADFMIQRRKRHEPKNN